MSNYNSIEKIISAEILRTNEDNLIANKICNTAYSGDIKNAVLIELSDFNRRLSGYSIAPSVIASFETEISCHELVGNILAPLRVAMLISIWYDRELYELLKSSYRDAYENAKKSLPSMVKHITEVY